MTHLLIVPGQSAREELAQYRSRGGYQGLAQAVARGPDWVLAELGQAGLRGRGGSGQGAPTAAKWARVAGALNPTRYVVANGAESSPVSRKDRLLMATYPHRVLEGLLCAAVATGAAQGHIYIRSDAAGAIAGMRIALDEAEAAGLCGPGTACPVSLRIHMGVPGYIAGEASTAAPTWLRPLAPATRRLPVSWPCCCITGAVTAPTRAVSPSWRCGPWSVFPSSGAANLGTCWRCLTVLGIDCYGCCASSSARCISAGVLQLKNSFSTLPKRASSPALTARTRIRS